MALEYEIRDPIHRTVMIDESERRVLDHAWVQRLRHIRQLGFVSLVYPGAVHDRFQHSVGVMHLAAAMFDDIVARCRHELSGFAEADLGYARRVARFAGLLHDLGHAPFSHTAEAHFPAIDRFRLPDDWYRQGHRPDVRQAGHEDATLALIHGLSQRGVLAEDLARDVCAVLSPLVRRSRRLAGLGSLVAILRALVSGEIDADRGDYLLRDSHFTGVTYGLYDLPRLRACLVLVPGPEGPRLGLDVHGVHALESLLLARYHMFLQVYFHKTPPAFEYFLGRALEAGEVALPLERGVDDLVEQRDDTIISQLHRARAAGGAWSRRILDREPAKLVLRERVGAGEAENFLAQALRSELEADGCHVFQRRSRQHFTRLAGAGVGGGDGAGGEGVDLPCMRRVLGRTVVEPVAVHSHLLRAFNRPIDLQHTYVLREDGERARAVVARMEHL